MFSCLHCLPDNHSNVWEKDGEENTDDDGRRVDSHHVPQSWGSWKDLKKVFLNWFIWKSHRARLFCRSDKAQRPWKLMKGWNSYSDNIKKFHYEWKVVQQKKMLSKTDDQKKGKVPKKRRTLGCTWWGGKRWAFGRRGRSWRRPWAHRACGSCSASSDHDHGVKEGECVVEDHDNDDDGNGNDDPLRTLKFVVLCESWNS